MKRPALLCLAILLAGSFMTACGPGEQPESLRELRRVRSGNLDVVLLSANDALRQGKDSFIIEFRSAKDGQLTDGGDVRASATMPMAGMAPMNGSIEVRRTDTNGRYSVTTDLSMAGDWRIAVEWDGPSGRGSAMLSTSAQ